MTPPVTIEECIIDASAPLEDILALLKKRGGIVVKGCLSVEDCLAIKAELQPHIDAQDPARLPPKPESVRPRGVHSQAKEADEELVHSCRGDVFFPATTRKVGALVTKSETYATK